MVARWTILLTISLGLHAGAGIALSVWGGSAFKASPNLTLPQGGTKGAIVYFLSIDPRQETIVEVERQTPADKIVTEQESDAAVNASNTEMSEEAEMAAPVSEVAVVPEVALPSSAIASEPEPIDSSNAMPSSWPFDAMQIANELASDVQRSMNRILDVLGTAMASMPIDPPSDEQPEVMSSTDVHAEHGEQSNSINKESTRADNHPVGDSTAGVVRGPSPMASNRPPKYPEKARRRKESGTVLVHVVIDASGRVTHAALARSSGYSLLDDAAVVAAESWRFRPALSNAGPIGCEADLPVVFRLKD